MLVEKDERIMMNNAHRMDGIGTGLAVGSKADEPGLLILIRHSDGSV